MKVACLLEALTTARIDLALAQDKVAEALAAVEEVEANLLAAVMAAVPEIVEGIGDGWDAHLICGEWVLTIKNTGETYLLHADRCVVIA